LSGLNIPPAGGQWFAVLTGRPYRPPAAGDKEIVGVVAAYQLSRELKGGKESKLAERFFDLASGVLFQASSDASGQFAVDV
jgi:hypothetical protein